MRLRRWMVALLLPAVLLTTGCFARSSSYRRPCCPPQQAMLPATPVPVTAASPCCPCQ